MMIERRMLSDYTITKNSNSYKSIALKVLKYGKDSKDTKFLQHESIVLDMSSANEDEVMLPKYRINGKKSSIKYALAETIWYASMQRETNLIARFGPIWKKMEDENGLVNSNYGYQIFKNQDFKETVAKLVKDGKARFFIASDDNQFSRSDLVCNNAVDIYLDKESGKIKVRVVARSIDLVYGYPYDVFAAQLFVRYVQKYLEEEYHLQTKFMTLRFDIENVHIYKKDEVTIKSIADIDDRKFIAINAGRIFSEIDFLKRHKRFERMTDGTVKIIRDELAKDAFEFTIDGLKPVEEVQFRILRESQPHIIKSALVTGDKAQRRFDDVVTYLNNDQFDRKNLVKVDDKLLYITKVKIGIFRSMEYEVMIYEL